MGKLSIAQLLSAPTSKSQEDQADPKVKERNEILSMWKTRYLSSTGKVDNILIKDRVNIKRLHDIYQTEKLKKLMMFYLDNYKDLKYLKGLPSIGALSAFRKRIEHDMETKHAGQYSDEAMTFNNLR